MVYRTRTKRESGQVIPLIALALMTLIGAGGIGVDVGYLEYRQQQQQTATDAAAAGGAETLLRAGCPNQNAAQASAQADAALNGYASGASISINVANPPSNGPFGGNPCAVFVTINSQSTPTFFARLFGYSNGLQETTRAAAVVTNSGGGCIYLLNPNTTSNFNNTNVSATQCGVLMNDTGNFNGATFDAPSIGYAGSAPNVSGATFAAGSPAPMVPVADPCPEISGCAYLTANPPPQTGCTSVNGHGGTVNLTAGCYSSLNLNGATVNMAPGTYVLSGSENLTSATISGSGITIYVPAGATPPNFNGTNQVSLSPPTSGNETGVLYYQASSNMNAPNFNGANVNYSGLIYCPSCDVNFNGADGKYLVLVFGAVNFNSNSTYDFATPPPQQSLVKQAVVAE